MHCCPSLLTWTTNGRSFFSSFVCGGVVRHSPPSAPGPWRRSPLGALRARESGTPTRSGVGSLGLTVPLVSFDPASSDQRDGARESAHHTRARPQGRRDGSATTDKTGTPNDKGTTHGFLLRRGRPIVPRAPGASWSPPRATSRTRLRHWRGDEPCGRSLIARTASGSAARCAST
jgi:hypothetical protein